MAVHAPTTAAPEVRSGDAYHGRPADMWALGVTLYCFLFADLPFKVGPCAAHVHAELPHGYGSMPACMCVQSQGCVR